MLDLLLLIIGITLGFLWWSVIILPVFYGVPKTIVYVFKGLLRKSATIFCLKSFVLWNVAFIVAAALFVSYFPDLQYMLRNSESFFIGQWIGIGICALRIFTRDGRKDLAYDFWRPMMKYLDYQNPSFVELFVSTDAKILIEAFGGQAAEK